MFGLGFPEMIVILIILFFLFGAKKIPEIGTGLGRTVRELRKMKEGKKPPQELAKKDEKEKEPGPQSASGNIVSDIKKEVESIPGLKEAKAIKETADTLKNITKILK
jgi:sec-independent protein translocase protein TatA